MFRDSIWYPNSPRSIAFVGVIVLMVVLHQSQFLGLMDSTSLVFGWLPMQIAYDASFNVVGIGILYVLYRAAPEPPESFDANREG